MITRNGIMLRFVPWLDGRCTGEESVITVHKTLVLNVVGLTPSLLGENTPRINQIRSSGILSHIDPVLPAVTCSVQSSYLTGSWPDEHGIVGNGWYFREEAEVRFWRQSNRLVLRPKVWDLARKRDPSFTVNNLFWWYNMYSSADRSVTPRPMYLADGRKLPDIYTNPPHLRQDLQEKLGTFPLFKFWGPASDIESTQWIVRATIEVDRIYPATLTLVYLPHLDYVLQKSGPDHESVACALRKVDSEVGKLVDHFPDARIILLSEYGITPVDQPIHINRILRENGFIAVREELGRELLDFGASRAFAVADHQIAHVYLNDPSCLAEVRSILTAIPGIDRVYASEDRSEVRLNHPRAGDLVVFSKPNAWFTYYYWVTDESAPDFARTVDIHRKPGYDPVELFLDPRMKLPKLQIAWKLLKRKVGFRCLLDVIPLDASLVRGSHGARPNTLSNGPLILSNCRFLIDQELYPAPEVCQIILRHVFD